MMEATDLLNLLYLIIFNYFSINTDIQVTNIYTSNYSQLYLKSLQNLFKQNIIVRADLLFISHFYYNIKLHLNTIDPYAYFLSNRSYFTY